MIYPNNFEQRIGFNVVRREIESRCLSSLGTSQCEAMRFSSNFEEVTRLLTQTNEFLSILQSGKEFPLNHFFDVRPALKQIAVAGSFLTEESLFNLHRSLLTIIEIINFFKTDNDEASPFPELKNLAGKMFEFPEIIAETTRILDKFGNIKDTASPQLAQLRRDLASTTASINGTLRRIMANARQAGIIDKDATPSIRDGRLVIPVSPMNKRKLHGIVHDESATGRTVFIEPAEIVEANNNIRELEADIHHEIVRILSAVSSLIRPFLPDLIDTYNTLGLFDFIRAKALFAQSIDACLPHIERTQQIELYHAVHPGLLLSLRSQGKDVVPLNIVLSQRDRILLISGPNAGGKSVCLKTVGIIQYMAQCGVLPPVYYNSHLGIFRNIFIDIGDQQSIEDDLSTYSSHLNNMKTFINKGDSQSLVLIDEFGSGTEPQIGGAIAQAILERLNQKGVFGVITTHYQNLKHFAEDSQGIVNGAMLYDRHLMQPLFQLSVGYPGSSFAIEIARKIGLPLDVISKASELVGSDYINMDKYLLDIARDRKYWETKRQEIHTKEKKINSLIEQYNEKVEDVTRRHREIIKTAKSEARDILAQSNASIERTIREIKSAQADKEKTRELRQQLEEFKQRIQADDSPSQDLLPQQIVTKNKKKKQQQQVETSLKVGDTVTLDGSTSVGTIISIEGKNATVAFGDFKTQAKLANLKATAKKVETAQRTSFLSRSTTDEIRKRQLNFSPDIDVRGMRAAEAIQAITYFIDDAIQFNAKRLRILHGTGTGILKVRIREYLNTINGVKSYRDEHVQLGGAGITIVDLV